MLSRLRRTLAALLLLGALGCSQNPAPSTGPATRAATSRSVMQPSFTVGDTWEYRNYQIGTGALNRTWVEVVTQAGDGFARIRRTDSTGQPPSEQNITV